MGVDFMVIIDHHMPVEDLFALPDRLNAAWQPPVELARWGDTHAEGPTRWEWERYLPAVSLAEELGTERYVRIAGPDGFCAAVFPHGIEVSHVARWWSFLYEPEVQVGLQRASRLVAATVGAAHILFLPDDRHPPAGAWDVLARGGSVSDALEWLRSRVGAPLPDPAVFLGREDDERDESAWFYEHREGE